MARIGFLLERRWARVRTLDWFSPQLLVDESTGGVPRDFRWMWSWSGDEHPPWAVGLGFGLEPEAALRRLLWLHRSAMRDEVAGRWDSADIHWRAHGRALRRFDRNESWERAASSLAKAWEAGEARAFLDDPQSVRKVVLEEVFLDCELALLNSWMKRKKVDFRRFRGAVERGRNLLERSVATGEEKADLIDVLRGVEVDAFQAGSEMDRAVDLCANLPASWKTRFEDQDRWIDAEVNRCLEGLTEKDTNWARVQDEARVDGSLRRLDRYLRIFPDNPQPHFARGLLFSLRASLLANQGKLSDALLNVERAIASDPSEDQYQQLRTVTVNGLVQLQAQVAEIEAQLANDPNRSLNAEGEELSRQARAGFGPAKRFSESAEPGQVTQDLVERIAARSLHELGVPMGRNLSGQAKLEIWQGLQPLVDSPPESPEELDRRLEDSVPEELVTSQLLEVLHTRLIDEPKKTEVMEGRTERSIPLVRLDSTTKVDAPLPTVLFWWGPEALLTKGFAVTALVLLLLSAGSAWTASRDRAQRDDAYRGLLAAIEENHSTEAVKAAVSFRETRGAADDARLLQVEELEQLSRQQPGVERRDRALHELERALARGRLEPAIEAAERFLEALPAELEAEEPRREQVIDAYSRALVVWSIGASPESQPAVDRRWKRYRQLVPVTRNGG